MKRRWSSVEFPFSKAQIMVQYEVDALPEPSMTNVRKLLRASMSLPQLSPDEAASLVVSHLINRTRSRKSRLRRKSKVGIND